MRNHIIFLMLLILMVSCSSEEIETSHKEYNFPPLGWKFSLPNHWKYKKGSDVKTAIEEYEKNSITSQTPNMPFQDLFKLEAKAGLNTLTSEVSNFSIDESKVRNLALRFKETHTSDLKSKLHELDIANGNLNIKIIDDKIFYSFEQKVKSGRREDLYYYIEYYIGHVRDKILVIRYQCIYGTSECIDAKAAIEESQFMEI